jgi:hypothetical protein
MKVKVFLFLSTIINRPCCFSGMSWERPSLSAGYKGKDMKFQGDNLRGGWRADRGVRCMSSLIIKKGFSM